MERERKETDWQARGRKLEGGGRERRLRTCEETERCSPDIFGILAFAAPG